MEEWRTEGREDWVLFTEFQTRKQEQHQLTSVDIREVRKREIWSHTDIQLRRWRQSQSNANANHNR